MADNPLLPQSRLRELHALIQHVRHLERRAAQRGAPASRREALVAAMLLHLGPGDLVSAPGGDRTLRQLAPTCPGTGGNHDLPANLRLPLSAGAARGMQVAGTDRITAVYCEAGNSEPGWPDAISWAHREQLPWLLICADTQFRSASRNTRRVHPLLTWTAMTQLARKLRVPLFPVDGHDPVAVYRVMQESAARARARGGPAVLWAVLRAEPLTARDQPLARLEAYMALRNISL